MINKNKFSRLEQQTRDLIKEIRTTIITTYPTYNGTMLLFRNLIKLFATDLSSEHHTNFENASIEIERLLQNHPDQLHKYLQIKDVSDTVEKTFKFLFYEDENIINECWEFIKFFVENIY